MSALEVRRLSSISEHQIYEPVRRLVRGQILGQLFRIAISLLLLPLDNTILVVALALRCLSLFLPFLNRIHQRRELLHDLQFRPRTVLITGVNTPHGLCVARCWYNEGHRVVGADITGAGYQSGESMSRSLMAYYSILEPQYVSQLLDIVLREKVDIWIPCSRDTSAADDSLAKQAIESRTSCKCATLDPQLSLKWSRPESFLQYLREQELPAVENHRVLSRDSIHKILHRSPTKTYHIRQTAPAVDVEKTIVLPKRTLSLTYLEVSEMRISKDNPWLMQQYARLGEFIAELLLIRGRVTAIMISPASLESAWGASPLNEGLATAIHRVIDRFASKGGPRISGHFSVRLMVDEELVSNSVRYEVRIAECTQGAAHIAHLLQKTPSRTLVNGYLAILSDSETSKSSANAFGRGTSISLRLGQSPSVYQTIKKLDVRRALPALYPVAQNTDWAMHEACKLVLFWMNWRFSIIDPLPWWWHTHVYWPLTELSRILHSVKEALFSSQAAV